MPKGIDVYGKKCAARRREIFLTQPKVAALIGQSVENIKRIEKYRISAIGLDLVEPLATALRLSVDDFRRDYMVPEIATDTEAVILPKSIAQELRDRAGPVPLADFVKKMLRKEKRGRTLAVIKRSGVQVGATRQAPAGAKRPQAEKKLEGSASR